MVRGVSYMFVTGPNVVKTVTHEEVSFDELGGADTHGGVSGVAHFVHDSEAECIQAIRELMGFLPLNNLDQPPQRPTGDPVDRRDEALLDLIPDSANKPYDMHGVIGRVVDDSAFLEVQRGHADNIVVGFARLGGTPGGHRGQPARGAGRGAGYQRLAQGGALHPLLRLLQHPAGDLRGRAGIPARRGAGARRHHQARRQAALRLLRGDGAQAHRDYPEGLRWGLRRHELEAHPGRRQPGLAVGGDRGDGAPRARSRSSSRTRSRGRPTRRLPPGGSSRNTPRSSPTRTRPRPGGISTMSSIPGIPVPG